MNNTFQNRRDDDDDDDDDNDILYTSVSQKYFFVYT